MHLRFSRDIEKLLQQLAEKPLTVSDIIAETSERGFSLVIGLLVLPFLFPMPPGFTTVLGAGSLLLGLQMALGRRTPWLPKKIARFRFPHKFVLLLLNNLKRGTGWIEKIAKPRWKKLAQHPYTWRFTGLCIAWLTVLLMLPIPFTNPIPTIAILLLVIATMESDGLLICLSYFFTGLISFLFLVAGDFIVRSVNHLIYLMQ